MDESFKKIIKEGLSSLIKSFKNDSSKTQAIGVDIGSSCVKIVQLKKRGGKPVLETYGVLALGPYNSTEVGSVTNLKPDDIARAIVDLMKEANVTSNNAVVAIPSLSSLIFTLSLPNKIAEGEMAKIIPIEARKYIPVPISEVALDWFVIPEEGESFEETKVDKSKTKVDVLVVAIHNDTIAQYKDIVKKTSLICNSFEMEIFSNIRSILGHELSPTMIVDFGASRAKVSIIEGGILRVFHVVNRGSQDITRNISQSLNITFEEAEKLKRSVGLDATMDPRIEKIVKMSIDYIFTDINSIVFDYQKKYNRTVSKVFLTGGGSMMKGFLEASRENFRADVVYADPFSKTETPAFIQPVLQTSGPEFSVALGLALHQLS